FCLFYLIFRLSVLIRNPIPHSCPTRRSSDLRTVSFATSTRPGSTARAERQQAQRDSHRQGERTGQGRRRGRRRQAHRGDHRLRRDRKSTRLNSSHDSISYAVFCYKKKSI